MKQQRRDTAPVRVGVRRAMAVGFGLMGALGVGLAGLAVWGRKPPILDLRGVAYEGHRGNKRKDAPHGITLHAMGFDRGPDPLRYKNVKAHFIVTRAGRIAQLHDLSERLASANGLNEDTVSIEFAGNPPSTKGSCWKSNKFGCHDATPEQVRAGRELIRWLVRSHNFSEVWAHRQSSAKRGNDPGPQLWSQVGEWAQGLSGVRRTTTQVVDDGRPIPDDWT